MDDLKPTDDSTKEPVSQPGDQPADSQVDTPQPTPPEPAPTAPSVPPAIEPEKPPEPSSPPIMTTTTTTEEKPKLSARFPKSPKKKIITGVAILLMVVLGGISVVTAWKLRQVEKVTPEEAEAWVGSACSADCEIVVGPGKFSFIAGGHGMRDVKNATISLTIPAGAQGHEGYAFWSGSGEWPYNDTTIKVNDQNVNAVKVFNGKDPKVGNSQIANLGKIPDGLVKGKTGKIDFQVRGLNNLNSDGRPGSGHGIGIVLIYTGDNVGNSKIIFRLWGEWLYQAYAAFDSGAGGDKSTVMQFNLSDLDATRSSDNKFAFFFGEGEKYRELCQDVGNGGRLRPSHLFYKTTGDWIRLNANTGTSKKWPACPLPEDQQPGHWWATRVTGTNIDSISLAGNNIKFTADSLVREDGGSFGESYTFVGAVAQYPVAESTPTPTPPPGCWDTCTPGTCPQTPLPLECQDVDGLRCVNPACPSEQACECPTLACLDLTSDQDITGLKEGDIVKLTCAGESGVDHVEFRAQIDGGSWQDLGTGSSPEFSVDYTISQTGDYRIECQVCTDTECTDWGKAEVATP